MYDVADLRFTPVWRIVVGLSLIPAFGTLYQRLTLPESTRYEKSHEAELIEQGVLKKEKMGVEVGVHPTESESSVDKGPSVPAAKKTHFLGMVPWCRIPSLVSRMI
jgi:PHS family inorganic phosphate transporter-like MFS transporter